MLKYSFFGSPSRGAHSTAALLIILLFLAEAFMLVIFVGFIRPKNPMLANFQNAIIDPIGIRWIVAITVLGGCLLIICYIEMWLMRSSRAYGKRGQENYIELEEARQGPQEQNWERRHKEQQKQEQQQARQYKKQQKQHEKQQKEFRKQQRKLQNRKGPGSHLQGQHYQGDQHQGDQDQRDQYQGGRNFGASIVDREQSSPRSRAPIRGRGAEHETDSEDEYESRPREAGRGRAGPGESYAHTSNEFAPDRTPSYKTVDSMPRNPRPAYLPERSYKL